MSDRDRGPLLPTGPVDVFISYAPEDTAQVRALEQRLAVSDQTLAPARASV